MKPVNIDVKKVARLANLKLSEEEEREYSGQLLDILGYVDQLKSVDTEKVEPLFNIQEDATSFRYEDEPQPSLTQEEALLNAPNAKDGYFVTKGVFESE
jgi:aspartyl-tRNA(Asn)/glutamyl-tRNA(Gln) amidotransferase subunit C